MNRRGDALRLSDIAKAMLRIEQYTEHGRGAFYDSLIVQDAVIRQLTIIGEAAGHLSEATRSANPKIPWRSMRGFASFAKHEYWAMRVDLVWKAVEECQALVGRIRRIEPGSNDRMRGTWPRRSNSTHAGRANHGFVVVKRQNRFHEP